MEAHYGTMQLNKLTGWATDLFIGLWVGHRTNPVGADAFG